MPEKPSTTLARLAAVTRWAGLTPEERAAATAAAHTRSPASLLYWLEKVDPDRVLDEHERVCQAKEKRSEYFRAMATERERRRAEARRAGEAHAA